MLSVLLSTAMALATPAPAAASWQQGLDWHGMHAGMEHGADGSYTLRWNFGERRIPPQPLHVETASTLFNGLYAMAQDDLQHDSVSAIRDGAFDHGRPIPCHCFETGLKWPYVWTRDLSYAVDLGLWRFDPARARNGLEFKLSDVRVPGAPPGPLVMEDTGSGGSWPVSTDRVVWFLAARHLLDDEGFAAKVWPALRHTLAQDRQYAFDERMGLYRGETSFLDWRQQSYPAWTADNVVPIAQSFALSTNVLHYQALELAAQLATQHHDADADAAQSYSHQARALKAAINAHFWRADRDMYMSYIGGDGAPYDTYDMLGIALVITSGVAPAEHARQALAHYPSYPAGTPVIWPERADEPIYHNRAIWPFVSAYALRAARDVNDPARIALQLRSIIRGAALAGSNMESYELHTQGIHVDEGPLSGPVVNSPRQLWSVAGYLAAVTEGVFGLTADGQIQPKLPTRLVPMLFGERTSIALQLPDRRIVLKLPDAHVGNLLVAGSASTQDTTTTVTLKAITVPQLPLRTDSPLTAPVAPAAPVLTAEAHGWSLDVAEKSVLYVNGQRRGVIDGRARIAGADGLQCVSLTRLGEHGMESLHSAPACVGPVDQVTGAWPRHWTAPRDGRYRIWLRYQNAHGSIQTGVTAAVKMLSIHCGDAEPTRVPVVMPHSVGEQSSTYASFRAKAGAGCSFALEDGFNMSYLSHFAHYTGGEGGSEGPLNEARVEQLLIAPLPAGDRAP